jgi:hypothetical protein
MLHIYLLTNNSLIHNSLYVLDKREENLSHKNVYYNYSKKVCTDPDKQRPDKWSSTVLANLVPFACTCPY